MLREFIIRASHGHPPTSHLLELNKRLQTVSLLGTLQLPTITMALKKVIFVLSDYSYIICNQKSWA